MLQTHASFSRFFFPLPTLRFFASACSRTPRFLPVQLMPCPFPGLRCIPKPYAPSFLSAHSDFRAFPQLSASLCLRTPSLLRCLTFSPRLFRASASRFSVLYSLRIRSSSSISLARTRLMKPTIPQLRCQVLAPLYLRRTFTRPVSYYALF